MNWKIALLICCGVILMGCQSEMGAESVEVAITTVPISTQLAPTSTPMTTLSEIDFTTTPIPDRQLDMVYQPFERGFMLWDMVDNCVYAFVEDEPNRGIIIPTSLEKEYTPGNRYTYCLPKPDRHIPEQTMEVPEGLQIPTDRIGIIWCAYPDVQTELGFATDSAQEFVARIPHEGMDNSAVCCNVAALPDGRVLYCGRYAHSSGSCSVSEKNDEG